jgi:hypothetical protein
LTNPIKANQYQSLQKTSILIFLILHTIIRGIDAKKTLKKAIVTGPKDSVAILILKKADDHIKAKKHKTE